MVRVDFQNLGRGRKFFVQQSHHFFQVDRIAVRTDQHRGAIHQPLGGHDRGNPFAQPFLDVFHQLGHRVVFQRLVLRFDRVAFLQGIQVRLVDAGKGLAVKLAKLCHHKIVHLVVEVEHFQPLSAEIFQVGIAFDGFPGRPGVVKNFLLPFPHAGDVIVQRGHVLGVFTDGRIVSRQFQESLLVGFIGCDALLEHLSILRPERGVFLGVVLGQ